MTSHCSLCFLSGFLVAFAGALAVIVVWVAIVNATEEYTHTHQHIRFIVIVREKPQYPAAVCNIHVHTCMYVSDCCIKWVSEWMNEWGEQMNGSQQWQCQTVT